MSPVMTRCPCGFPLAECLEHGPSPDTSGLTLDGPPVVVTIAVGAVSVMAVVVIAGVAVATWAVGAVIDAIRGDA